MDLEKWGKWLWVRQRLRYKGIAKSASEWDLECRRRCGVASRKRAETPGWLPGTDGRALFRGCIMTPRGAKGLKWSMTIDQPWRLPYLQWNCRSIYSLLPMEPNVTDSPWKFSTFLVHYEVMRSTLYRRKYCKHKIKTYIP